MSRRNGQRKRDFCKRSTEIRWHVYILRCRNDALYTGVTTDVERRVSEHNRGVGARYTRAFRPVELVYSENAVDRAHALRRERAIKQLSRARKLALVGERVS